LPHDLRGCVRSPPSPLVSYPLAGPVKRRWVKASASMRGIRASTSKAIACCTPGRRKALRPWRSYNSMMRADRLLGLGVNEVVGGHFSFPLGVGGHKVLNKAPGNRPAMSASTRSSASCFVEVARQSFGPVRSDFRQPVGRAHDLGADMVRPGTLHHVVEHPNEIAQHLVAGCAGASRSRDYPATATRELSPMFLRCRGPAG
jgi:hypothetical protein